MPWVAFTTDEYEQWHDAKCAEHGIPRPGRNALTGEVRVDAEWTLAYATPTHEVRHGKEQLLVVHVPDADAGKGLRVVDVSTRDAATPARVIIDGAERLAAPAQVDGLKAKPDEITVDGQVYPRATRDP